MKIFISDWHWSALIIVAFGGGLGAILGLSYDAVMLGIALGAIVGLAVYSIFGPLTFIICFYILVSSVLFAIVYAAEYIAQLVEFATYSSGVAFAIAAMLGIVYGVCVSQLITRGFRTVINLHSGLRVFWGVRFQLALWSFAAMLSVAINPWVVAALIGVILIIKAPDIDG